MAAESETVVEVMDQPASDGGSVSASKHRRSRLSRRRRRPRRRQSWPLLGDDAGTALVLAVFCSALGLGGLHWAPLLLTSVFALAAGFLALSNASRRDAFWPVMIPLALAAYTALQAVPMPATVVRALSPAAATVWAGALSPFGESGAKWVTLSVDPGATILEALKWFTYAAVFAAAIATGMRRGAQWGALLVFASAATVGVVTFTHGLIGMHRVYGVYAPTFATGRWRVGPLLNPNNLSGYLNLGLLAGFGVMFSRRRTLSRVVIGVGVASLAAVVVVCASRGGVVAMLVGVTVFGALVRPIWRQRTPEGSLPRRYVILAAVVLGALSLAWLGGNHETRKELFDKNLEKLEVMTHVAPLLRDYLVFGVGRGAFESVFPAYHVGANNVVYAHPENFIVQWLSEWGVFVGAGAMFAFASLMWQVRGIVRHKVAAAGMGAGLLALLLQNLLDLGLEVPGIAIAFIAALGTLWGGAQRETPEAESGSSGDEGSFRWYRAALIGVGAALCALVIAFGRDRDTEARARVHRAFVKANLSDDTDVAALKDELHKVMSRYPADPYFARIGAIVAWHARQTPIPWLARALERGMEVGATHYELARILAQVGRLPQAFPELRRAITYQPELAAPGARLITATTRRFDDVEQAVPEGILGTGPLYFVAVNLRRDRAPELRLRCLEAAMQRDPDAVLVRTTYVDDVLAALAAGAASPVCELNREHCIDVVNRQVADLLKLAPDEPLALTKKAQLWMTTGRASQAEWLLREGCNRFAYEAFVRCGRIRVQAALAVGSRQLLDEASRDLAAAGCGFGRSCGDVFTFLGRSAESLGETGRALSYYQRAATEEPTDANWLNVARAATAMGENALASSALSQVVRRNPGDSDTRQELHEQNRRTVIRILQR